MKLVVRRGTRATARLFARGIGLFTALLVFALATAPARADCVAAGGTAYVCSNPTLTSQAISDVDAHVTTLPGFSVDTTISGGPALTIAATGELSYIDTFASGLLSPDYGLYAVNTGVGAGFIDIQTNGAINGGVAALFVQNMALGNTNILATGPLTGANGLFAVNSDATSAGNLTIATGSIDATGVGLASIVYGTGRTDINVQGAITGTALGGIVATAGPGNTGGLFVTANAVTAQSGIIVQNFGLGTSSVTGLGTITATNGGGVGVTVVDSTNASAVTIDTARIDSTLQSILVDTDGLGATTINTHGTISSTNDSGVDVFGSNAANTGGFVINTNAINALGDGVALGNFGLGDSLISTNGAVTAQLGAGIYSVLANAASSGSLTVNAQSVSGGYAGIDVFNGGLGITTINANGVVQGDIGILALAAGGGAIAININGEVRKTNNSPAGKVISADGGPVTVTNSGRLTGRLELGDLDDFTINNGLWRTRGNNDFGLGTDSVLNGAGGTIVAAHDALTNETTRFRDLESYGGAGTLSLTDGGTGDVLTMSGNASFASGAILDLDLAASGANDTLAIAGTANLNGLSVRVSQTGARLIGQTFDVLTATGGLSGKLQGILDARATAYIKLVDSYDATDAFLTVAQVQPLASPARTPNQQATVAALNGLPTGDPLIQALLASPTDDAARAALDALSGDLAPSLQSVLLNNSRQIRDAIIAQLRAGFAAETTSAAPTAYAATDLAAPAPADRHIWSQGFGDWGQLASDGNAGRLQTTTGGLIIGADAVVSNGWRFGAVGSYAGTNVSSPDRASSSDIKSYSAGLYGGTEWGAVAFRSGLAYSWNDINTTRSVTLTGLSQTLSAHYSGGTAQAFGELAYRTKAGTIDLEPFANLAYVNARTEGFTETGGSAALTTQASTTGTVFTTLGLRASSKFVLGETTLVTMRGMVGWQQGFGATPAVVSSFAGTGAFTILGLPVANGAFVAEAGMDFELSEHAKVGLNYTGRIGQNGFDHSLSAKLGVAF